MLVTIVILFVVCWLPLHILSKSSFSFHHIIITLLTLLSKYQIKYSGFQCFGLFIKLIFAKYTLSMLRKQPIFVRQKNLLLVFQVQNFYCYYFTITLLIIIIIILIVMRMIENYFAYRNYFFFVFSQKTFRNENWQNFSFFNRNERNNSISHSF